MIIVEGGDNVGKTTLIQQLIGIDPNLHVLRRPRFKPEQGQTIGTSYLDAIIPRDGDRVRHSYGIADRLLASEMIYGDLFRNGSRLTEAERQAILNVLRSYRAIVVHCDPPDETVLREWKNREQLYDDPIVIVAEYRRRIRTIFEGLTVIRYDWTAEHAEETRSHLVDLHRRIQLSLFPRARV